MPAAATVLVLAPLLAAPPADAVPPAALVLPLRGDVALAAPEDGARRAGAAPPALVAGEWRNVGAGQALRLGPGAEARLLCPDGTCRRLDRSVATAAEVCDDPAATPCDGLDPRSSDPVAETLEHWNSQAGTWRLLGRARDPRQAWGRDPVLVSPRCPESGRRPLACEAWLSEPGELLFLEVDEAARYVFELTGPGRFEPLSATPAQMRCAPWPSFDGHRVCRLPWPAAWRLGAGAELRLRMKVEVAGRLRARQPPTLLRGLDEAERRPLVEALARSSRWPPAVAEPWRLLAYQRHGLVAELHAELVRRPSPSPALEVTLGRGWLQLGFAEPARHHFARVAEAARAAPPAIRAEAEMGLARCALELDDPAAARRHLARAAAAFARLGLAHRRGDVAALARRLAAAER